MIKLSVPAALPYRDLVTRAVATACKVVMSPSGGDPTDLSNAMVSAVGEAFNNVVEHAYDNRGDGAVLFEIEHDDAVLTVRVTDNGRGFDIDDVPDPDLDALPPPGMGVYIIRAFVDDLTYTEGPPNVLTMIKRL